ncbi:MAG: S9 family peptidase [Alphaproteobacteria bacterium]|nr:S9 family peptidase [Alphaproteobacteria bacterium]
MKVWIIIGLVILGALYYWYERSKHSPVPVEVTKLIPREVLLGNPDRAGVKISPDGRYLSFIAPHEGVMNIWVQDLEGGKEAIPYTFDKGRGIRDYQWTFEPNVLIYMQDEKGDENWRLYKVDLGSKKSTLLTPGEKIQARITHLHYSKPDKVLVSLNSRNPIYHDLYELDLKTNKLKIVYENNEFLDLTVLPNFTLRYAMKQTEGGASVYYRLDDKGQWNEYRTLKPEDLLTTGLIGFSDDGTYAYWLDSTESDKSLLTRVHQETGEKEILYSPKKADLTEVFTHPQDKTVLAVVEEYLKPEYHVLDNTIQKDVEILKALESGVFQVVSTSSDFKKWVVAYKSDTSMPHYYLYDRPLQKATYLFSMKKDLENYTMNPVHPVEIKTRDGLTMAGYLILPNGVKGTMPQKPVPLVLNVHGGPQTRDNWGFNGSMQWLSNRGYAVLQVNYRGSAGFGKAFLNAGNGEWAAKAHDDLIDAVNWAIDEKIADPSKVAIFGGSYGGYATLVGLTFTPDVFACGVDIVGPSNLITLFKSIPEYWKPALEELKQRLGGNPDTPEGAEILKQKSPLTYVDRIKKPLLIAQGANDPRVKQAESDQIVSVMREKNIPVTYLLYPDEGHGFARPENRLAFYAKAEEFLAKVLGGRVEPAGDCIEKSSVHIDPAIGE